MHFCNRWWQEVSCCSKGKGNCHARWGIGWFEVLKIVQSGWNFVQQYNSIMPFRWKANQSFTLTILGHYEPFLTKKWPIFPFEWYVGPTMAFFSAQNLMKTYRIKNGPKLSKNSLNKTLRFFSSKRHYRVTLSNRVSYILNTFDLSISWR